jgi:hypothetical protein
MEDPVAAMRFGRFGREDNTLVLVTTGGTLHTKILKRTAHFENLEMASGPLLGLATKLNVPKRTKLFVDQTLRERENAVLMHRYSSKKKKRRVECCSQGTTKGKMGEAHVLKKGKRERM